MVAEHDIRPNAQEQCSREDEARKNDACAVLFVRRARREQCVLHVLLTHVDPRKEQVHDERKVEQRLYAAHSEWPFQLVYAGAAHRVVGALHARLVEPLRSHGVDQAHHVKHDKEAKAHERQRVAHHTQHPERGTQRKVHGAVRGQWAHRAGQRLRARRCRADVG